MKCLRWKCNNPTSNRLFCSDQCSDSHTRVRARREIKLRLIAEHGGRCKRCGYNKCVGALDFHHRDPTMKEFGLGGSSRGYEKVKSEAAKCDLLCANCHREIEYEKMQATRVLDRVGSLRHPKVIAVCGTCRQNFLVSQRRLAVSKSGKVFCSKSCNSKSQLRVAWPDARALRQLVNQVGYEAVGRQLGVSGNAVKKRLLSSGV
jgi:hypothetical protein